MAQSIGATPASGKGLTEKERVAALHADAQAAYATGQHAREGMDRAEARRRASWSKPAPAQDTQS
ncbi:hypothetical protein [Streptomyces europaeiscabiei]|uniref:hypothetical protein n=1 Tax=Streptomyces europaeiscabiei TaxID=146819 RepID=UPI002E14D5E9|nr:hypothetical protein OHB30_33050 [Streptomyces europaeiscabiei]